MSVMVTAHQIYGTFVLRILQWILFYTLKLSSITLKSWKPCRNIFKVQQYINPMMMIKVQFLKNDYQMYESDDTSAKVQIISYIRRNFSVFIYIFPCCMLYHFLDSTPRIIICQKSLNTILQLEKNTYKMLWAMTNCSDRIGMPSLEISSRMDCDCRSKLWP